MQANSRLRHKDKELHTLLRKTDSRRQADGRPDQGGLAVPSLNRGSLSHRYSCFEPVQVYGALMCHLTD